MQSKVTILNTGNHFKKCLLNLIHVVLVTGGKKYLFTLPSLHTCLHPLRECIRGSRHQNGNRYCEQLAVFSFSVTVSIELFCGGVEPI